MAKNKNRHPINKVNLVISIVLTFAAWLYVMYNVDPALTKTFRGVPVQIVNQDILAENGMVVRSVEYDTIDVRVEARRSVLTEMTNDDIKVTADVADTGRGDNVIAIKVSKPPEAKIEAKSRDSITIQVDTYEVRTVPLNVKVKDDDDWYVWTYDAPDEIMVEGYGTELNALTGINTKTIDLTKITETSEVPLTYDFPENVKLNSESEGLTMTVYVTPRIEGTIVVPASAVKVTGAADNLEYAVQDDVSITVIGTEGELAEIGYGQFEVTVDLSSYTEAGTVEADVSMTTDVPRSTLATSKVHVELTAIEQPEETEDQEG
ncbi:MAG: hypothetical protein IJH91_06920 [Mogibacterium sp.]|nr:hypothetical protein [Mogibacterium sp.]